MRSEGAEGSSSTSDCDDPLVVIACAAESSACPAACREDKDNKEPEIVKSGDLVVTAKAAEGRRVIVNPNVAVASDLDTLTFKTSEEVTISKITLERYGYTTDGIKGVWLEDEDGNVIAEAREVNSKDQVALSIKKDYRTVDGTFRATVVVEMAAGAATAGGTLGFKVIDADSTAANLNLDSYDPYTYDVVSYNGSEVTLSRFGSNKDYNYEAGDLYEVARFRVKTPTAILINGFTLTNKHATTAAHLDLDKYLDKVEVTVNGEALDVKYSVNKDDELVISFDDYELGANKAASFVVSISLTDFDDYDRGSVQYEITGAANFKASEKKTGARVSVVDDGSTWAIHVFRGSKIRLTNTKLSKVEGAAGSEGLVVAEGTISVSEAVKLTKDFTIYATNTGVDKMTLVTAGEEYEVNAPKVRYFADDAAYIAAVKTKGDVVYLADAGKYYTVNANGAATDDTAKTEVAGVPFTFSKVLFEESGKVQFTIDLKEESAGSVDFKKSLTAGFVFNKDLFDGALYDANSKEVDETLDVAGSISFVSANIKAAKGALENNLDTDKPVEFLKDTTSRKVVFDGVYTAKKGLVNLNRYYIKQGDAFSAGNDARFYIFIDGEEVADTDTFGTYNNFSYVSLDAGESVDVKVELEMTVAIANDDCDNYELYLIGEDKDGLDIGEAHAALTAIKTKTAGSVVIPAESKYKTVILKGKNRTIASFRVKPSNGSTDTELDNIILTTHTNIAKTSDIKVLVNNSEIEANSDVDFTYVPDETIVIPAEGIEVSVVYKGLVPDGVAVVASVNGKATNQFSRMVVPALVEVTKQANRTSSTEYTLKVTKYDEEYTVENLNFYTYKTKGTPCTDYTDAAECVKVNSTAKATLLEDDTWRIDNLPKDTGAMSIEAITYVVKDGNGSAIAGANPVVIYKADFEDFFDLGDADLTLYANS